MCTHVSFNIADAHGGASCCNGRPGKCSKCSSCTQDGQGCQEQIQRQRAQVHIALPRRAPNLSNAAMGSAISTQQQANVAGCVAGHILCVAERQLMILTTVRLCLVLTMQLSLACTTGCFDHEEEAAKAYDKMMLWCELHNATAVKGGITNYDAAEYQGDLPFLQQCTQVTA
eukprot:364584-Chlamydomonas_euryale.AAC.4